MYTMLNNDFILNTNDKLISFNQLLTDIKPLNKSVKVSTKLYAKIVLYK